MELEICFNEALHVILIPTKSLRPPIYLKRIEGSLIKPEQIYGVGNKMNSLPVSRARPLWLCDIPVVLGIITLLIDTFVCFI